MNRNKIKVAYTLLIIFVAIVVIININKKEVYKLEFYGLDCDTPFVRFFSNGRYEYLYEGREIKDEIVPMFKKGKYKIDIPKLIENDKTYTHDMNIRGFYMFSEPGGNKKMVHADNKELIEFLEKNDIDLDRCITYK